MIYPLKNWQTAKRGYRFGEKTFYSDHHLGVDHIVPIGTLVLAPCDCEIVYARSELQGGKTIWISFFDANYGQLTVRFMHLDDMRPIGKYAEGEVLGFSGNTGKLTTAPHLHTDISRGKVDIKNFGNFINPEKYFVIKENKLSIIQKVFNLFGDTRFVNSTKTYRKIGTEKIYALAGDILIPFDISLKTYKKEFGQVEIVDLNEDEFANYKIAKGVRIVE